jgi:ABC-type sugar transport system substrate-binding protein
MISTGDVLALSPGECQYFNNNTDNIQGGKMQIKYLVKHLSGGWLVL